MASCQFLERSDCFPCGIGFLLTVLQLLKVTEILDADDFGHQPQEISLVGFLVLRQEFDNARSDVPLVVVPVHPAEDPRVTDRVEEKAPKI